MLAFLLTPQFLQEEGGRERDLEVCPHSILFISPLFSGGVVGGCQESLLIQQQARGGALGAGFQYPRCPPCGSAVLLTATVFALTSFPEKGPPAGWRDAVLPNLSLWEPRLPSRRQRSWSLCSHISPLPEAESAVRTSIPAAFGFGPHHAGRWQWNLVMGARFFLETQDTSWRGAGRRTMRLYRPPVHPAFPPRAGNIQAPLSSALPSSVSVDPAGDSPLPSGVRAVELQDRGFAHNGVSEGLPVGARRQSSGKQQEIAAGVADPTPPLCQVPPISSSSYPLAAVPGLALPPH